MNNGHVIVISRPKTSTTKHKNWVNIRLHANTEKSINLDATYQKNAENLPEEIQIPSISKSDHYNIDSANAK